MGVVHGSRGRRSVLPVREDSNHGLQSVRLHPDSDRRAQADNYHALALCGLALVGRPDQLAEARIAFRAACSITPAKTRKSGRYEGYLGRDSPGGMRPPAMVRPSVALWH
jgi:hypothetical protein